MSKQPKEVFRIVIYEDGSAVIKTETDEVKGSIKGPGSLIPAMLILLYGICGERVRTQSPFLLVRR